MGGSRAVGKDHQGMPEILDVTERDGEYFSVVAVVINGEAQAFEFGIDSEAYQAVWKIIHRRPFGVTEVGSYRYYFLPGTHRLEPERDQGKFLIRIEQNGKARQYSATGPRALIAHLTWFADLKYTNGARHLRRVPLRVGV